jgi:hypothetical protein
MTQSQYYTIITACMREIHCIEDGLQKSKFRTSGPTDGLDVMPSMQPSCCLQRMTLLNPQGASPSHGEDNNTGPVGWAHHLKTNPW